jgi:hypothetical protein
MRVLKFFAFFLITFSCVEPYEFVISDESPSLVVEGFISDKSFYDARLYPSDGRFFTIRLTSTSSVTNVRPTGVANASVKLIGDNGEQWNYSESHQKAGMYELKDSTFKAIAGVGYKIQINANDDVFESSWETLPDVEVPTIGSVGFDETESERYVIEAGKKVLRTIKEIKTHITVAPNPTGKSIHYRWKFSPMWVFIAPLSPSVTRPGYKCWVTSDDYLNTYALQIDNNGGYKKDLFRVPTIANERILDDFSVLVQQYAMNEGNYFFWKEMYDQNEGSVLMDQPPFNLQSNLQSSSEDKKVIGYFGVVQEQATRWYFNRSQLSYAVENAFKAGCEIVYGPPLPGCPEPLPAYPACECKYCLDYSKGVPTNVKPSWWND